MDVRGNRDENKVRWIRVSVEFLEHPMLDKGPYDRRSAWLWLIANAAWRDKRINHKGRPILLKRGQVLAGRKYLAETWGWGEQMVRSFLLMLQHEHMVETNQSNGHFANVITICNYEKYQSVSDEKGQSNNQSVTSAQPVSNQTFTSSTSYTNNPITPVSPRTPRIEKPTRQSGSDYWSKAINPEPEPEHKTVTLDASGKPILHNGTRAHWLEKFGGDDERLDLALEQAKGWIQPNSSRPLEAQVSAQLARTLAEKLDRDQRYERAAAKAAPAGNGSAFLALLDKRKGVSA